MVSPLRANVYPDYVFDFWAQQRFEQFSLELHGGKTRLLEFNRYAIDRRQRNGQGKPRTFNFVGLTFICGSSRRGGRR